jgi:hypothetical protein
VNVSKYTLQYINFHQNQLYKIILHHLTTKHIYTINQTNSYLNQTVTKESDLQLINKKKKRKLTIKKCQIHNMQEQQQNRKKKENTSVKA